MVDVGSRVHRILRPLAGFQDLKISPDWPAVLAPLPELAASETALGLYSGETKKLSDAIVFTTKSMYVRTEKSWLQILYSDIERAIAPTTKTGGLTSQLLEFASSNPRK